MVQCPPLGQTKNTRKYILQEDTKRLISSPFTSTDFNNVFLPFCSSSSQGWALRMPNQSKWNDGKFENFIAKIQKSNHVLASYVHLSSWLQKATATVWRKRATGFFFLFFLSEYILLIFFQVHLESNEPLSMYSESESCAFSYNARGFSGSCHRRCRIFETFFWNVFWQTV